MLPSTWHVSSRAWDIQPRSKWWGRIRSLLAAYGVKHIVIAQSRSPEMHRDLQKRHKLSLNSGIAYLNRLRHETIQSL
jgi:hypothetical protein